MPIISINHNYTIISCFLMSMSFCWISAKNLPIQYLRSCNSWAFFPSRNKQPSHLLFFLATIGPPYNMTLGKWQSSGHIAFNPPISFPPIFIITCAVYVSSQSFHYHHHSDVTIKKTKGQLRSRYLPGSGKVRTTRVYYMQSYSSCMQEVVSMARTRKFLATWQQLCQLRQGSLYYEVTISHK